MFRSGQAPVPITWQILLGRVILPPRLASGRYRCSELPAVFSVGGKYRIWYSSKIPFPATHLSHEHLRPQPMNLRNETAYIIRPRHHSQYGRSHLRQDRRDTAFSMILFCLEKYQKQTDNIPPAVSKESSGNHKENSL